MADRKEIVRQIGELVEELGRIVDQEQADSTAEARRQIAELTSELEKARTREEEALGARQEFEREAEIAERRIESLVQKLKDARQAAADAVEESQKTLRRQLEALQEECDEARAELDQERSVRKRLEKGAAADEKRLSELEKALAGKPVSAAGSAGSDKAVAKLQGELADTVRKLQEERESREGVEEELTEAHRLIAALEKAVKQSKAAAEGAAGAEVQKLTDQLKAAEARLDVALQDAEKQALACAAAEKRVAELEEALSRSPRASGRVEMGEGGGGAPAIKPLSDKPLPHELRPAPKPGALFYPDWDLAGLPCKSGDQVFQAWNSVFNVQLSLEGYPSQYCAAFLVVLKQGKTKQLYIVFNLKGSKHVLVCVPSKLPTDEASLNKAIAEGTKYLQMSGFELEKIPSDDIARQLDSYFLKG